MDKVGVVVVVVDLLGEFRVLVFMIMPGNRIWRFPDWFLAFLCFLWMRMGKVRELFGG